MSGKEGQVRQWMVRLPQPSGSVAAQSGLSSVAPKTPFCTVCPTAVPSSRCQILCALEESQGFTLGNSASDCPYLFGFLG